MVATVLNTPELRALWEKELAGMRVRIKQMRVALVEKLKAAGVKQRLRLHHAASSACSATRA